jgi:acyl carrier protein
MDVRAELQQILAIEILGCEPAKLSYSADLLALGLDSLSIVALLNFIEDRLKIRVPAKLVSANSVRSIDAIAALLESIQAR